MDPGNPETVYIANTQVYKSTDRGTSSTSIGPNLHRFPMTILKIAPSNSNHLVASDGERIYKTRDGGGNWYQMDTALFPTYITDVAIHPNNPEMIWVSIGGYGRWNSQFTWLNIPYETDKPKVFFSSDGGLQWQNVSGVLPNIPVNCIVIDPQSLNVYLGTDLGVFYSESGMGEWQRFDNGLPNVIITELEIHPSTGKLVAATYGRGVWQSSLANLPQVYSPLTFSGEKVENLSFLQTEMIHALRWTANPANIDADGNNMISGYRIYLLDEFSRTLLVELGNDTFNYWQRNLENKTYRYALVAVSPDGTESRELVVTL
jgi:hypothetical protein